MAANKFATVLHRNTHRVAVVLVYTLLEWILIALLLLNALFSYLISKFASYFGLTPPCLFCSRVDHLFQGGSGGDRGNSSYRDLLCDAHAAEISRLGYCSNHRRLAEGGGMCEACSSSRPSPSDRCHRTVALISVVKRGEEEEESSRCSCCGVELESSRFYSPYLFLKQSWGVLGYTQKGNFVKEKGAEGESQEEEGFKDEISNEEAVVVGEVKVVSPICADEGLEKETEEKKEVMDDGEEENEMEGEDEASVLLSEQEASALLKSSDLCCREEDGDASFEILNQRHLHASNEEHERLVPVELIDSITLKCPDSHTYVGENDEEHGQIRVEMISVTVDVGTALDNSMAPIMAVEIKDEKVCSPTHETVDKIEDCSSVVSHVDEHNGDSLDPQGFQTIPQDGADEVEAVVMEGDCKEPQDTIVYEEGNRMLDAEASEVSIGSEICDQEQIDQAQIHDSQTPLIDLHDQSSENHNEATDRDLVIEIEPADAIDQGLNHHLSICPEHNEVEEERPPETPTYVEGIHNLHKRFLFERREPGTESLDGSVASEIDGSDILTVEHFKSALKAERKALSALYAELEEERSASAIAANQTMAMITRLQEEKAAMQMEALQYQRMMEEQSEYDQEALQLLNELMMKREKENQDLEKELELYRKKVLLYEAKERRRLNRTRANRRSGTSSASSSAEDSDDLSFELNDGDEKFNGLNESNQNTPADTVLSSTTEQETAKHLSTLDESFADFEEERLSILEQLKALEEKLFTLDDGEDYPENKVIEHFPEENGHGCDEDYEFCNNDMNGSMIGFSDDLDNNGEQHNVRRNMGSEGKRLLPLFDAVSMENEDNLYEEQQATDLSQGSLSKFTSEQKKLAIAEEVDNVYERLQALEADREFLKHCIRSLKKGDKGMDLLQEILQHLRDLRTVDLRVRNAGDTLASLAA